MLKNVGFRELIEWDPCFVEDLRETDDDLLPETVGGFWVDPDNFFVCSSICFIVVNNESVSFIEDELLLLSKLLF